jgi:DNA-binding transcriptional regulator PaaX
MKSSLYILKALIPYSRENIKFSFQRNEFFKELSKKQQISEAAVRNSVQRAINKSLIKIDESGIPRLTQKGYRTLAPFTSKKLRGAKLMVAFDIPESKRRQRDHFRLVLREFYFRPLQKSVWTTNLDCKEYIQTEINQLNLNKEIKIFEARELN